MKGFKSGAKEDFAGFLQSTESQKSNNNDVDLSATKSPFTTSPQYFPPSAGGLSPIYSFPPPNQLYLPKTKPISQTRPKPMEGNDLYSGMNWFSPFPPSLPNSSTGKGMGTQDFRNPLPPPVQSNRDLNTNNTQVMRPPPQARLPRKPKKAPPRPVQLPPPRRASQQVQPPPVLGPPSRQSGPPLGGMRGYHDNGHGPDRHRHSHPHPPHPNLNNNNDNLGNTDGVPGPDGNYPSLPSLFSTINFNPPPMYYNTGYPTAKSPTSPSKYVSLLEGFLKPPTTGETYPGGKDNTKMPLPLQVVKLHPEFLPPGLDPRALSVKVRVLGFDKNTGDKKIIGDMSERRFVCRKRDDKKIWTCDFDYLVCKFSSHSNGGKLALRFSLYDANKRDLCHIDSDHFITITKRGMEKKMERQKKRKREVITETAKIITCQPAVGLTAGGQLVKIFGEGFSNISPMKIRIKFGNNICSEVITIKRNIIICETPKSQRIGEVKVMISLDGVTFLPSDASFMYIDPKDENGLKRIVNEMVRISGMSGGGNQNGFFMK